MTEEKEAEDWLMEMTKGVARWEMVVVVEEWVSGWNGGEGVSGGNEDKK